MTARSFSYWLLCTVAAAIAVGAAEPEMHGSLTFTMSETSSISPVPEPGRALLLFTGLMAMAFTYRRAWLNLKRGS